MDYRGWAGELLGWVIVLLFLVAIVGVPVWSATSFLEFLGIDTETSWDVAKGLFVIGMWVLILLGGARRDSREKAERKRRSEIARNAPFARWGMKKPADREAAR